MLIIQAYCETLSDFARTLKPKSHTHVRSLSEDSSLPVYNYSCQARNSTKQTLASLRQNLEAKKTLHHLPGLSLRVVQPSGPRGESKS